MLISKRFVALATVMVAVPLVSVVSAPAAQAASSRF